MTTQGSNCNSLLGQLQIWPSIAVESETAIRVDIDGELRDVLLLLTQGVTHAITSSCNVGEGDSRCGLRDLLSGAFDLNRSHLDVLIKAHGAITREDQVHVQDEWNLSFVMTTQGSNCNSLLGQLEIWPSITVESETAIRVDIDGELRDILLLLTEGVTHAITSGRDVGECDTRSGLCDLLSGAFDLNRGDLDVLIKAHGAITRPM